MLYLARCAVSALQAVLAISQNAIRPLQYPFADHVTHCSHTRAAGSANIVLSNDDGWAEMNIRTFYHALVASGENVILSAPADNESATGSRDSHPKQREKACQFDSCPSHSPAYGYNSTDPRINYVNSYPVTSIKYGLFTLSNKFFDKSPDLAVTGPNVGRSGTVGAAVAASKQGIPGIAFSGSRKSRTAWNAVVPSHALVYADLAVNVTQAILASSSPYLPQGVWLNVNFGPSTETTCTSAADFRFVLSRIIPAVPFVTPDDVATCGKTRLPTDIAVVSAEGCWASISVGKTTNKLDASASQQAIVLAKLDFLLSCLP